MSKINDIVDLSKKVEQCIGFGSINGKVFINDDFTIDVEGDVDFHRNNPIIITALPPPMSFSFSFPNKWLDSFPPSAIQPPPLLSNSKGEKFFKSKKLLIILAAI